MFGFRRRPWLFVAAALTAGALGCGPGDTGESLDESGAGFGPFGRSASILSGKGKGPSGSGGPGQGTPFESASVCDDGNPCTVDFVAGPSCVHHQMPQHWPCDDGNECTVGDQCLQGVCTGAGAADGSACSDGDACTRSDSCESGRCVGSNPVVCTALDQCHDAGECDPATGSCSDPPVADDTPCDDDDACTQTDTCQSGACTGADRVECTASDPCHVAGTCDPATGVCDDPPAADGTACDDGNACTQTDACIAGKCEGWNPKVCTAWNQCHLPGKCDPATGSCGGAAFEDGTACDDGDACTVGDTCQSGTCTGGTAVACGAASTPCHVSVCDPAMGGCTQIPAPDGEACDDGNACTLTDTCQSGACVGSNAVECLDGPCWTAGTCDPATGICSQIKKPNGLACDDDNPCTKDDKCLGGNCKGTNVTNGTTCDPDDLCSRCQGGHCKPNAVSCPGAATCNPVTGLCAGAMAAILPSSVTFTVLYTSCEDSALDLRINGAVVETLTPEPECRCDRGPEIIVIEDPEVLASITGCDDTFSLGEGALGEAVAIGFVEVTVEYEDEPASRACLFDARKGGACAPRDLCEAFELGLPAPSTPALRRGSCAER